MGHFQRPAQIGQNELHAFHSQSINKQYPVPT